MVRFVVRAAGLTALAVIGILVAAQPSAAQFFNQGFNRGFGNDNFTAPARSPASTEANAATNAARAGQEASTVNAGRAFVTVRAPESADVWLAGVKATKKGAEHKFSIGPRNSQEEAQYAVRARWTTKDGKEVDRTKNVQVRSGQRVVVDFEN